MNIIPAIDILGGRCVRLSQGDYERCTTYSGDPVDEARRFEDAGFARLHLVDLDGARSATVSSLSVLERICSRTRLSVDFGGGVRSDGDLRRIFAAGADLACVGSVAAADPETVIRWLEAYGRDRIIVSADVSGDTVRTHGWRQDGGMTIDGLINTYGTRLRWLMCTDIRRDGMLGGAAVGLYRRLAEKYPFLDVIASGGIGSSADIADLSGCGARAVVVGKAIYENRVTLSELQALNADGRRTKTASLRDVSLCALPLGAAAPASAETETNKPLNHVG